MYILFFLLQRCVPPFLLEGYPWSWTWICARFIGHKYAAWFQNANQICNSFLLHALILTIGRLKQWCTFLFMLGIPTMSSVFLAICASSGSRTHAEFEKWSRRLCYCVVWSHPSLLGFCCLAPVLGLPQGGYANGILIELFTVNSPERQQFHISGSTVWSWYMRAKCSGIFCA